MTILIIDDQISVVNGLKTGVHFEKLGIKEVYTALNAEEAREVIENHRVDLMLCDIEMPGENGLELNEWVKENHPDILRILLSSHKDFSYAVTSLKLGCFDYIVQPAPYDEIEECLGRAVDKIKSDREEKKILDYGKLYLSEEAELNSSIVYGLYSRNLDNVRNSIQRLNEMGYPLTEESQIRLVLFDIYSYSLGAAMGPSAKEIQSTITDAVKEYILDGENYALLTRNRYKQFVLLIFSDQAGQLAGGKEKYDGMYKVLSERLKEEGACYVGGVSSFRNIREEIMKLHFFADNNVSRKPGIYYAEGQSMQEESHDFSDYIKKWEFLLDNRQFSSLSSAILSYIDFISSVNKIHFKGLCDLHQQLSYLFFDFAYRNDIDIASLFQGDYKYNDYMDSFKNVDSIRQAVVFIINALENACEDDRGENDVQKAKDYIMNNISRNITVADVSAYVHLSPEYFTKLFKKETGQNIKTYIMQTKVEVAKDLLANPGMPVSLVALELGYTNFSHFTQLFKKFENITPSEYRKKIFPSEK